MRKLMMPSNGLVKLSPRHKGVSENAKAARWSVWHQEKNQGVEPCAVKAARTVLNGGDEETCGNVTRLVPTQPGSWARLKRGVIAPSKLGVSCRVRVPAGEGRATHP